MDKTRIKQSLIKGWLRSVPEHAKNMESNLSWANTSKRNQQKARYRMNRSGRRIT